MNKVRQFAQAPLALILFMPFFYYPISNSVVLPLLERIAPGLADSSRTLVAMLLALLVIAGILTNVLCNWKSFKRIKVSAFLTEPLTWACLLALWFIAVTILQPQVSSAQNLTAYVISLTLLAATYFNTQLLEKLVPSWTIALALLIILAGVIGVFSYSIFLFIGSNPRLYATYGVIAMCMLFAVRIPTPIRVFFVAGLYVAIVISQSRAAFVTALVVALVGTIAVAKRPIITSVAAALSGVAILLITLNTPIISSRMAVNSITSEGLSINDSGRAVGWRVIVESFQGAPFFGQGAGSGQTVTLRDAWPIDHPHSEYLRVLHDGGLVAAILAAFLIAVLLWQLFPRRGGQVRDPLIVGAFLLVVAALVLGTIENFLVFPSLMWPAAVLIGLGLKKSRESTNFIT